MAKSLEDPSTFELIEVAAMPRGMTEEEALIFLDSGQLPNDAPSNADARYAATPSDDPNSPGMSDGEALGFLADVDNTAV
jgi:hypothetical protein